METAYEVGGDYYDIYSRREQIGFFEEIPKSPNRARLI